MASSSSNIDLTGPTFCIVTGASQGIGKVIAIEFSKLFGPNSVLLLLARKTEELAQTAKLCESDNVKVIYKSIDLSVATEQEMYDIISQALSGHKVTDFTANIIFHNVGSLGNMSIKTSCIENVNEMRSYYDLNVFKVISLNTQFLKLFEEVEDRIIIVNITSLCAVKPMSGMAFYCSGKAAREMYFRVLAEEKKDMIVLNYSPGPVETTMIDVVIDKTVNENLRDVFTTFKKQGTLLKAETTVRKCIKVLVAGKFKSGDHVDFFDDE
ncbi:sepiapterin reductase [Pieris napi]|uniref:sepiapterin reductase n=1 Tax=Pieris napi TaxID=78633 RepID=UPI001FBAB806|nr:sepiapterin reductase [Pieris napi]